MSRHAILLLTLVSCVCVSQRANAQYRTWAGGVIPLTYDAGSFPAGKYRDALQESVDIWNRVSSPFKITLAVDPTRGVGHRNGQSEVWFGRHRSAYCLNQFRGNRVVESDIVFGQSQPWTTSHKKSDLWGYGGGGRPFQATAVHELGHAVPLAHENAEYNIMGMDFQHLHVNGDTAKTYVGEDASFWTRVLYGADNASQDLSVTHWRYHGTSGEYSTHRKTRVRNSSGGNLGSFSAGGERTFVVAPGQTVQVEFTYENNGASAQADVPIGYFLSTDSLITTLDRRIGGKSLTVEGEDVDTHFTAVTIPADAPLGRHWLGVVIDETDALAEVDETNNATYLPIDIR